MKSCQKSCMNPVLTSKIVSEMSPERNFTREKIKCTTSKSKAIKSVSLWLNDKRTATERFVDDFNQSIEEGFDADYAAVTHLCENGRCKIKIPHDTPSKSACMRDHKFISIMLFHCSLKSLVDMESMREKNAVSESSEALFAFYFCLERIKI